MLRSGLACTQVKVRVRETQVVRTYSHIVGLITEARLPERARQRALAAFARLAEVEGRLHRRPTAQVHFHEIGGTDAIIDIVGTCVALELLGVDEIRASPVALGGKGLGGPAKATPLTYSGPREDGGTETRSGNGSPVKQGTATATGSKEPSRNAPCPCGSGKKYKLCHGRPGAV